jgi:hypothetical protein
VLDLSRTPRIGNSEIVIWSGSAANVYGGNHPGDNDDTKVAYVQGDGTTTEFDVSITLPLDVTITDANRLNVVVEVVGQTGVTLPVRQNDGAGPAAAGQFLVVDADTISIGGLADGQVARVILPTVTQVTGGALTANREYNVPSFDYGTASALTNVRGAQGF